MLHSYTNISSMLSLNERIAVLLNHVRLQCMLLDVLNSTVPNSNVLRGSPNHDSVNLSKSADTLLYL